MSSSKITVSSLRQYIFCPRIYYFENILDFKPPKPFWTKQGENSHARETQLFKRRTLARFHLGEAERYTQLWMEDPELGITGVVDLLLVHNKRIYPVEFKADSRIMATIKIQLKGYAWLAEKRFGGESKGGFLVSTDKKKTIPVKFSPQWREKLTHKIEQIQHLHQCQFLPASDANAAKCTQCEYLIRCDDRF